MDKTTNTIDTISRTCIAVRLRLLNRVVTNFYDDALRPLGLKVSQLNLLLVTARLGLARPARLAGGRARRGRPHPAVPPHGTGPAADCEGGAGLGRGSAPGR